MTRPSFKQEEFHFRRWGGARKGAGRKRQSEVPLVPHRARGAHDRRHPVHVTLRMRSRSLRAQFVFLNIRRVLAAVNRRCPETFRIVEFSVQSNHLHLLVEANACQALASGMRSLNIRLAVHVNRVLMRRGPLLADRWHSKELTSPRAVRNALRYVLANHAKHAPASGAPIDPCSSAPYFKHFAEYPGRRPSDEPHLQSDQPPPVAAARTWLLSVGWRRRYGPLSIREEPSVGRSSRQPAESR